MQQLITNSYEHKLAYFYHQIDKRGIYVNPILRKQLLDDIIELEKQKTELLSHLWNMHVYLGKENNQGKANALNLNAPEKVLEALKKLGYNIPKVRKKDKETGDIEYVDSVAELALRRAFAEESDPIRLQGLTILLDVREIVTLHKRYVNAKLYNNIYYANRNIAGTLTGRRSSRKNSFGLGGNDQNFPKHYALGQRFIQCLQPRPIEGNPYASIFFIVDQMQAEDWPVSALAENHNALTQLKSGFDRHTDLASFIFGIPKNSRTTKEWKDSIERYLGKKCRHAHNYGMHGQMMSDSLAKEGFSIAKARCDEMLAKVAEYDPQVASVFHTYVKNELYQKKLLRTPLGRERFFFGLKNNDTNYKILNEAYSYIPQSTVGDNTGLAVLYLCEHRGEVSEYIINESHDSITQEVENNFESLKAVLRQTTRSFDRPITFHNGITINIPIEGEIGFNLKDTIKLKTFDEKGLEEAYEKLVATLPRENNNAASVEEAVATGLS